MLKEFEDPRTAVLRKINDFVMRLRLAKTHRAHPPEHAVVPPPAQPHIWSDGLTRRFRASLKCSAIACAGDMLGTANIRLELGTLKRGFLSTVTLGSCGHPRVVTFHESLGKPPHEVRAASPFCGPRGGRGGSGESWEVDHSRAFAGFSAMHDGAFVCFVCEELTVGDLCRSAAACQWLC